jgi:hypothetical protein
VCEVVRAKKSLADKSNILLILVPGSGCERVYVVGQF